MTAYTTATVPYGLHALYEDFGMHGKQLVLKDNHED